MTSEPEERLMMHLKACRLPAPVREYRFDPKRKWRLDFAWPELRLAAEVDGGNGAGADATEIPRRTGRSSAGG